MEPRYLIAAAWSNGSHHKTGAGYGLKISAKDRDRFFDKSWKCVTLCLVANGEIRKATANVAKKSFWDNKCRELISKDIGRWLIRCGFERWCKGSPPRFKLIPRGRCLFDVEKAE